MLSFLNKEWLLCIWLTLLMKTTCTNLKNCVKRSSMKLLKNKKCLLEMNRLILSLKIYKMLSVNTTGKWCLLWLKKSVNSLKLKLSLNHLLEPWMTLWLRNKKFPENNQLKSVFLLTLLKLPKTWLLPKTDNKLKILLNNLHL